jgi:hypothetical protein
MGRNNADFHAGTGLVDVARGFRTTDVQQPLGMHWSTDEMVAHHFAGLGEPQSTVIYAKARSSDIIKPGSDEHRHVQKEHAVESENSLEQEASIRPGSRVIVTGVHKTNDKGKTRLRTYLRGKEMTA